MHARHIIIISARLLVPPTSLKLTLLRLPRTCIVSSHFLTQNFNVLFPIAPMLLAKEVCKINQLDGTLLIHNTSVHVDILNNVSLNCSELDRLCSTLTAKL